MVHTISNSTPSSVAGQAGSEVDRSLKFLAAELEANIDLRDDTSVPILRLVLDVIKAVQSGQGNGTLSALVDKLADTTSLYGKTYPDLVAERARTEESRKELEKLRIAHKPFTKVPPSGTVEEAIKWRMDKLRDVQAVLDGTESNGFIGLIARKDEFEEMLKLIKSGHLPDPNKSAETQKNEFRAKLRSVNEAIDFQNGVVNKFHSEIQALGAFKTSLENVKEGLPPELLRKQ